MRIYLLFFVFIYSALAQAKISGIQSGFYTMTSEKSVCGFEVQYDRMGGRISIINTTDPITARYCPDAGRMTRIFNGCSESFCREAGEKNPFLLTAPSAGTVKMESYNGAYSWTFKFVKKTATKPTVFYQNNHLIWVWVFNGDRCTLKDGSSRECTELKEADVINNWGDTNQALATAIPEIVELCKRYEHNVCTVAKTEIKLVVREPAPMGWGYITGYKISVKVIGSEK